MARVLLALAFVAAALPAFAQQLTLQLKDGRVTLDATGVLPCPLVGASVVVLHEPHDDTEPYGTAPAPDADPRDPAGIVLVELDQARPVRFDPDVAAYAKTEPD